MVIPDDILESVTLQDQYFDLKGLSAYSALAVSTLRDYIQRGQIPAYKLKGKLLVKRSQFDTWIEGYAMNRKELNQIVNDVIGCLKG